jgi:hypothetical protein
MKKSHAKATLSDARTTKPPRNQAIASLVIPYKVKEGSKARKRKKQREEPRALEYHMTHWEIHSPIQEKQSPRLMNE